MGDYSFTKKQREAIKVLNHIHNTHNDWLNDANYFLLMEFVVGNRDIAYFNDMWVNPKFGDKLVDPDCFKTHGIERGLHPTCCDNKP